MINDNLNRADKERRTEAYNAVQEELKCAQTTCKNILLWSRRLPIHAHSGERTKIKNMIGELVELSIAYDEGKNQL